VNSLTAPREVYLQRVGTPERRWLTAAIIWCIVLFVAMYAWPLLGGRQQTPFESYRIDSAEFRGLAEAHIANHTIGEYHGIPIVTPDADGAAYIVAQSFAWRPVLQIRKGETVRLYLSSYDVQHGLSIQPQNLNFQVLPGYVYVVHLTPTETGEFSLICNEYCGLGHHAMSGRILVVD
jgi:cytochrome c oxidase subunit II